MARYIDADKLHYSRVRIAHPDGTIGGYNAVVMSAEIKDAPTADVVEVKRGEWLVKIVYKTPVSHAYIEKRKIYICPFCKKEYRQNMNYCGNCGTKMGGERKGE